MRFIIILVLSSILVSCQKAQRDEDNSTNAAEDFMLAQTVYNDVFRYVRKVATNTKGIYHTDNMISTVYGCDVIKADTLSYPRTIIMDFKFIGCGATLERNGRIKASFYGTFADSASIVDIEFINYFFEDMEIGGKLRIIYKGKNSDGNQVHSFFLQNGSILDDDVTMSWTTSQQWIVVEKSNETVYYTSGTSNGTNRKGNVFFTETKQPCIISDACLYPLSGTVEIEVLNLSRRFLDYGNGECDFIGIVTINGTEYPVEVPL